MAKKRQEEVDPGAPAWILTFADLMSLLAAFFVLIISFSIQDDKKLQVVSGSMRESFGVEHFNNLAGLMQFEGTPVREHAKDITKEIDSEDINITETKDDSKQMQGPEKNTFDVEKADIEKLRNYALAADTIKQSFEQNPEILEASKNVLIEEEVDGLNIQLVDKSGRPMFPVGSKRPYKHTVELIKAMAPIIKSMPNLIKITGHTSGLYTADDQEKGWLLSAQRAEEVRRVLIKEGIPHSRFHSVVGMADSNPLYPEDPQLSINSRINISLISSKPAIPADAKLN